MSIRKGVDAIAKRNKEMAERAVRSNIPELFLRNDGDMAIFRLLNDDPLDVDFHEIYDKAISSRPMFPYCTMDDDGRCEYCESDIDLVRMFMFWVWVERILHTTQGDPLWTTVEVGQRTYFEESVQQIHIIKRKFGQRQALWDQFMTAFETTGTWKDRSFAFKRKGAPNDINTTYSLSALDREPIPDHVAKIMGKLPSLEAVAKGMVTDLDIEQVAVERRTQQPRKQAPRKEEKEQDVVVKDEAVVAKDEVEVPKDAVVVPPQDEVSVEAGEGESSGEPKVTVDLPETD